MEPSTGTDGIAQEVTTPHLPFSVNPKVALNMGRGGRGGELRGKGGQWRSSGL